MRSSIRQVAELAGVSRMTVSRVLQGRADLVADSTRIRVMEAARELRYVPVPNPVTQTRRTATRIVGLVFGDIKTYDQWGLPIYRGLCEVATERGYDLLTLLRSGPEWMIDQQELRFLDRRTDGFVFVVPTHQYKAMQTLLEHDIPVVTCSLNDVPAGIPAVGVEDAPCMQTMVNHLAERGHRRILHMAWDPSSPICWKRREGYATAMADLGLRSRTIDISDGWQEELRSAVLNDTVTAIIAASDTTAIAAWNYISSLGLEVPRDISITGMDDLPEAATRGLTTLGYSSEQVGRLAMTALIDLIAGDRYPADRTVVPHHLVERNSVATSNTR